MNRTHNLLRSESANQSVMSNSLWPHGLYSPWNSLGQNTGVSSLSFLQGIFPTQGSNSESPTLQADPLPAEPQGKPKNTRVGNLSLLQWIFPTQELNQGLLHCRQIIYQLSYQGSPRDVEIAHTTYTKMRPIFYLHYSGSPSFFRWKWKSLSRVWLFATLWSIQSVEFSRPEYCNG